MVATLHEHILDALSAGPLSTLSIACRLDHAVARAVEGIVAEQAALRGSGRPGYSLAPDVVAARRDTISRLQSRVDDARAAILSSLHDLQADGIVTCDAEGWLWAIRCDIEEVL